MIFIRCRINDGNRSAGPIIANYRHAVGIQQVQGKARPCRGCGLGAAQGQATHNIEHIQLIRCGQRNRIRGIQRGFVIHHDQAVAAAGLDIERTGQTAAIRLAAAENNAGIACVRIGRYRDLPSNASIRRAGLHVYVFAHQHKTVCRYILPGKAGADPGPVGLAIGQEFPCASRGADTFRLGIGLDTDILSRRQDRLLPYGHNAPVFLPGNIHRSRHIVVGALAVLPVEGIAADIVIGVRGGAQVIGNRIYQFSCVALGFKIVIRLGGHKRGERRKNITQCNSRLRIADGSILQLRLHRNCFPLPFFQFVGFAAEILKIFDQVIPRFPDPDIAKRTEAVFIFRVHTRFDVYAALFGYQRHAPGVPLAVLSGLQLYRCVVIHVAVQETDGDPHLRVLSRVLLLLVHHAGNRMGHGNYIALCRQRHIDARRRRLPLPVCLCRRTGGFQFHPRGHGHISRIGTIHHRYAGPCGHILQRVAEYVLQPGQLAPLLEAFHLQPAFEPRSQHAWVGLPCNQELNKLVCAFPVFIVGRNAKGIRLVGSAGINTACLYGTFQVHIGGRIVVQYGHRSRSKGLIHTLSYRFYGSIVFHQGRCRQPAARL